MKQHYQMVAGLNIAAGALFFLAGAGVFVFMLLTGGLVMSQGEHGIGGFLAIFGLFVACVLALLGLPSVVGGWALYAGKSWAKPLLIVLAILHLPNVPLGTALGVYTLWALLSDEQPPAQLPPPTTAPLA